MSDKINKTVTPGQGAVFNLSLLDRTVKALDEKLYKIRRRL